MSKLKRILLLTIVVLLLAGYATAFLFAILDKENGGSIAIYIFAVTTILSIFIGVLIRVQKYVEDKAEAQQDHYHD